MADPIALVVTPNFPPTKGGIESLLHGVVTSWSTFRPVVVTLASPGDRAFDSTQGFPVRRVADMRSRRSSIAALNAAALAYALRLRPSVVLSGHIVTSPASWAICRLLGIPFVQYLYGRELARRPRVARFAVSHAQASVAISAYTESLARGLVGTTRVHRIPPGIDVRNGALRSVSKGEVVTVARLVERSKGLDVLLAAMPLVLERIPEARLTVVGDGPLRPELESLASELGIARGVDFVGEVDDATRDEILGRAAVFALPSRVGADGGGEGFGIVYLEAGERGVPVVAGDAGGAVDAVVDGQTGLLVDPRDPRAVAGAIVKLLEDEELAGRMGSAGEWHARSFAWPDVSRRVEDVLSLAAGR